MSSPSYPPGSAPVGGEPDPASRMPGQRQGLEPPAGQPATSHAADAPSAASRLDPELALTYQRAAERLRSMVEKSGVVRHDDSDSDPSE